MSTQIGAVNSKQEKGLETLLAYRHLDYQKVAVTNNFSDEWPPNQKRPIQNGLADAEAGRYTSAKTFLAELDR